MSGRSLWNLVLVSVVGGLCTQALIGCSSGGSERQAAAPQVQQQQQRSSESHEQVQPQAQEQSTSQQQVHQQQQGLSESDGQVQPQAQEQSESEQQDQQASQALSSQQEEEATQPESLQQSNGDQSTLSAEEESSDSGFYGESFQEVDQFTGETATFLGIVGDGASPYDGFLYLACVEKDLRLVLANLPYVTSRTSSADLQFVTPETIGSPSRAPGRFYDSAGGDRNWELNDSRSRSLVKDPRVSGIGGHRFLWTIATSEQVTVRLQTYDQVFTATFEIGDITQAEHWDDIVACDGSVE